MTSISLLREKFTIREVGHGDIPVIALGNRLVIHLPKHTIPLVIRCHSMHMTLRLGAEIMRQLSYISHVEKPATLFNWDDMWQKLIKPFEGEVTPETWVVIYYKGHPIYNHNDHHMFFDIIEQCEYKSNSGGERYEKSITIAQNAFQKMGREVLIEEESHVGFVLDKSDIKQLRFAIILRVPGHRGTFITRLSPRTGGDLTIYASLAIAADYIEAINMSVRAGFAEKDMNTNNSKNRYEAVKNQNLILKRLGVLSSRIQQAEARYIMRYRPERPDFKSISKTCSEMA